MNTPLRVTVWNEFRQEREEEQVGKIYPRGIHRALAGPLEEQPDLTVSTATLDEPEHGLTAARLASTDVLLWWAHRAHHEVSEVTVTRIQERVLNGMGLLVLHSAHFSKIFERLMGASCRMARWEINGGGERLWTVAPGHPIAAGLPPCFELAREEMYSEPFDVPPPDELVFVSWFPSGELFRSGGLWRRGRGRVFYFRPGHEAFPTYHDPHIQRVLVNAVRWLGQPDRITA